jgi:hypothetical protein
VTFFVAGSPVTTTGLGTNGTAQGIFTLPSGAPLTAVYSGDDNFTQSGAARTGAGVLLNPAVVAAVHGAHPRSKSGWYRSAVTVSFECKPGSSGLAGPCPGAVRLTRSKAGQSVTRTVTDTDGGQASVKVSSISIDRVAPTLRVVRHGHELVCHATDGLSGVASCVVHKRSHTHGGETTVHWTAIAVDKAGNATSKSGHFAYVSR